MKSFLTNNNTKIIKVGREKKLYFTENDTYFLWCGHRQKLSEIPRLNYPVMYTDENDKLNYIGGYITISNCLGVLVQITENETVQLWTEKENI